MKTITQKELFLKLKKHAMWLLDESKGERADFTDCILKDLDLSYVNLNQAGFTGAKLNNVDFRGSNLNGASFVGATLVKVDFSGANLRSAFLNSTTLSEVTFIRANLEGIYLERAHFKSVELMDTIIKDSYHPFDKFKSVFGLRYTVIFFDDTVIVGCESHTYKEWLAFSNKEIMKMDKHALEFYHDYLVPIIKAEYKEELKWKQ